MIKELTDDQSVKTILTKIEKKWTNPKKNLISLPKKTYLNWYFHSFFTSNKQKTNQILCKPLFNKKVLLIQKSLLDFYNIHIDVIPFKMERLQKLTLDLTSSQINNNLFSHVTMAPPDPILGTAIAFNNDKSS